MNDPVPAGDIPEFSHLLTLFDEARHDLKIFMNGVVDYLVEHPKLNIPGREVVHSFKRRLKDPSHLVQKIKRKQSKEGIIVTPENFFTTITDLAGARILHLFQEQFRDIDTIIRKKISDGDWALFERPKAYTWDPENTEFFRAFDLDVSEKPTSYTSVHYVLMPRQDSTICCELQVRTLFEEIWGEVDHRINYPIPTKILACSEQIRVLSKLVGAGSRLLDSLHRTTTNGSAELAKEPLN